MKQTNKQIRTSIMTGKLKGIQALNTDTTSTEFCQLMQKTNSICKKCYSQQMLTGIRKNCIPMWKNNLIQLSKKLTDYELPRIINQQIFRLSSHGEVDNLNHANNYNRVVELNKDTFFGWWTKRSDLLKGLKRHKNCNYIYSNPKINDIKPKLPKKFDKIFSVYDKQFAIDNNIEINCGNKKCIDCKLCYTKNKTTHINELLK